MGFAVPGFSAISFSQLRGSVPTLKRRSPLIFSPLDIAPLMRKKKRRSPCPGVMLPSSILPISIAGRIGMYKFQFASNHG
jgi:hypothetical protein